MKTLSQRELASKLKELGIKKGDNLVVHSSMRSLGPVEDGADGVVDTLLECIGPMGLLVMPTFAWSKQFNPELTPSKTGALTEVFRKRTQTVRSFHPTHSVAACGKDAIALCEDHHLQPALGKDSPLDRLAKKDGGILLIGVSHDRNSTIHIGEAYANVPYLDIASINKPKYMTIYTPKPMVVELKMPPGCSRGFNKIESVFKENNVVEYLSIGSCLIQWVKSQDVIDITVRVLNEDPGYLLCEDKDCVHCTQARKSLAKSIT